MKTLVVFVVCVVCYATALNTRPIIGIITEPPDWSTTDGQQYIAASYVKFLEFAGARVVPVRYTTESSQLLTLLGYLNGFLFPGGGAPLSGQYLEALQTVWNYTLEVNQKGDYFPLWGTCLGFEELHVLATGGDLTVLTSFDSENYSVALNFTVDPKNQTRLFSNAPEGVLRTLATQNVTMNNHVRGVSPAQYTERKELSDIFNIISLNRDRKGLEFVSTVEAKNYPIYGAQWHAEKPLFEWNPTEAMNHSTDSILANQYTANFIVAEARKSNHTFPSFSDENEFLIYNYQPIYTWPQVHDFEQCYFFNDTDQRQQRISAGN